MVWAYNGRSGVHCPGMSFVLAMKKGVPYGLVALQWLTLSHSFIPLSGRLVEA